MENRYTISIVVPEELVGNNDYDQYVHSKMALQLAAKLSEDFPVSVTLNDKLFEDGSIQEVHTLSLLVFTDEQFNEFMQAVRKQVYLDMASDKVFNLMGEPKYVQ